MSAYSKKCKWFPHSTRRNTTIIGWIAMKCCPDICVPQWNNPADFGMLEFMTKYLQNSHLPQL